MMLKAIKSIILVILLWISLIAPEAAYADLYSGTSQGKGRTRTCSSSTGKVNDPIDFNPTSGGKDVQFDLANPVCQAIAVTSYAAVKAAIFTMNSYCNNPTPVRITPTPFMDVIDIGKGTYQCAQTRNQACCAAVTAATIALGAAIGMLGGIYGVAVETYDNTQVCGGDWMKPNPAQYDYSAANYKQTVQLAVEKYIRDNDNAALSMSNKTYREWFFGGKEFTDNPYDDSGICRDPTGGPGSKDQYGDYPIQKYYLKGTETGNYNCKNYLIVPGQSTIRNGKEINVADMNAAYECCMNRSQNYMCLDYKNPVTGDRTPTFCKKGENCTMMYPGYKDGDANAPAKVQQRPNGAIWFQIKSADAEGRLLCAETYSLCPYNFYVGGGSDYCDYYRDGIYDSSEERWKMITQEQIDKGECQGNSEVRNADCSYNQKAGQCRNYCQYLVHCTKTSTEGFIYQSNLGSPYFSQACIDFAGDSHNNVGYNTGVIIGKQMHFTAPIAQCIKESLENLFYNRAGHSRCATYNEYPNDDGTCPSGNYITTNPITPDNPDSTFQFIYKKGNQVKEHSFFQTVQRTMSLVIKLGISLAVMVYGIKLLLWQRSLGDKKDILVFILKIALVMYFCAGTAWQDVFFRGFYDASMSLAEIVFKIETLNDPLKQDGCQFGNVTLKDGTTQVFGDPYPDGKAYLAIWDTIDCKMMRYLGFGPQMTNANIASMVISAYFFGPIGIYFALSVMFFGLILVALGIRALHIFISSAAAIILLVFISPIVIPCGLFDKTKNIFSGWLSKLFSFCLQPMILFAYVAIFITVMDQTLIGSATFHGNPPLKTMSCKPVCYADDGTTVPYDGDQPPACDQPGQKLIDPLNDSVACMLNFNDFGSWKAFEVIGVALPMVQKLLGENVKERVLALLKGALVMYLLYLFLDEIPGITSALVGGGLKSSGPDPFKMLVKTINVTKGVSKRLGRVSVKTARSTLGSLANAAKYAGKKSSGGGGDSAIDSVGQRGGEGGAGDSVGQRNEGSASDSVGKK